MLSAYESVLKSIEELLRSLNGALRVAQLYPRGHSAITSSLEKAEKALSNLMQTRERLTLGILEDEVIFGDRAIYQSTQYAGYLVRVLRSNGVDRVTFMSGCNQTDLGELIDLLQKDAELINEMGGIQHTLQTRGIRRIVMERLTTPPLERKTDDIFMPEQIKAARLPDSLIVQAQSGLEDVVGSLNRRKPIPVDPTRAYVYELTQTLVDGQSPLLTLALLESHEDGWLKRLVKVSTLAVAFARQLGLSQQEIEALGTSAFLYDIGLLSLGVDIQDLSYADEAFQNHPVEGAKILLSGREVDRLSVIVAFEHHMWHDLSGFPKVVGKKRIHPVAELVGLIDTFVDLVSGGRDKPGCRSDQAILEISRYAGKRFDARLFTRFVAMTGVFSPGTFVRLNDGRIGIVIQTNPAHVLRPQLRIIKTSDGSILETPEFLDLSRESISTVILDAIDPSDHGIDSSLYR